MNIHRPPICQAHFDRCKRWSLLAALLLPTLAFAQSIAPLSFNLPAGRLDETMERFGEQAGLQVIYEQDQVRGKRSTPVNGMLPPAEALRRLLVDSGLGWEYVNGNSIVVRPAVAAPSIPHRIETRERVTDIRAIEVRAERRRQQDDARATLGALGDRSDMSIPFSLRTASRAQLDERQVHSMASAFFGDPSVIPLVGEDGINWATASISVRGLPLSISDSAKLDGLPMDTGFTEWPLETVQRLELLKGPSAFMHGFSAPGGVVNYIGKRAPDTPLLRVAAGYRSDRIYTLHADLGDRPGAAGTLGYRINLAQDKGTTYNGSELDRRLASLAMDAHWADNLSWEASMTWQDRMLEDAAPYFHLGDTLANAPPPVDGDRDFGVEGAFVGVQTWSARSSLRWWITPTWEASFVAGHTGYQQDVSFPYAVVQDEAGNFLLHGYAMGNRANSRLAQAMLDGSFDTGRLKHKVTSGLSWRTHRTDVPIAGITGCIDGCTGNLYSGSIRPGYLPTGSEEGHVRYSDSRQWSLFASDTVEFLPNWSAMIGLRYNDYRFVRFNLDGSVAEHYRSQPLSPTVALLHQPYSGLTTYASYAESLEQGITVGNAYLNGGQKLPVMISSQYEAGIKLARDSWDIDAAVFRIEQSAMLEKPGEDGPYLTQDGTNLYQGVEASMDLRLHATWTISAGASWLDASYRTLSAANINLLGNRVAGTSRLQSLLQATFSPMSIPGLNLHAGVRRYGDHYRDAANRLRLPAFVLANAGINYHLELAGRLVTLRGEINNLTGKRYWSAAGIGAPRTLSLNVSFDL